MDSRTVMLGRALFREDRHRAGSRKSCRCSDHHRHGTTAQERRRMRKSEAREWRRELNLG